MESRPARSRGKRREAPSKMTSRMRLAWLYAQPALVKAQSVADWAKVV